MTITWIIRSSQGQCLMLSAWHQARGSWSTDQNLIVHQRSEEHTSELQSQFHLVCPLFFLMIRRPPRSTPFPTRRSSDLSRAVLDAIGMAPGPWFLEYGSESNCPP